MTVRNQLSRLCRMCRLADATGQDRWHCNGKTRGCPCYCGRQN